MHSRTWLLAAALIASGCASSGGGGGESKASAYPAMSRQEYEAKMMAFGVPGEPHKRFERMAGEWSVAGKMWMDPEQPPMEMNGTSRNHLVLGGRFLVEEYKADFMGMPFEGMGMFGYDNATREYTTLWFDSMGTSWMEARGRYDADGKTMTQIGGWTCPVTGGRWGWRQVSREIDADHFGFEAYMTPPKGMPPPTDLPKGAPWGAETKVMEMTYSRKK